MNVIFRPFWGEYGIFIMEHIRYVHAYRATSKIICCNVGEEALFPSANQFIYGIPNPIPDRDRNTYGAGQVRDEEYRKLWFRFRQEYPGYVTVRERYPSQMEGVKSAKFRPEVRGSKFEPMDVVFAARNRQTGHTKNWDYWQETISQLRAHGLKVGIAGQYGTSMHIPSTAYGWMHELGPTAGAISLLDSCKLFVSTDTGVTHLAALMDVPIIMFRQEHPEHPDMSEYYLASTKGYFNKLPNSAWDNYREVIKAVLEYLK